MLEQTHVTLNIYRGDDFGQDFIFYSDDEMTTPIDLTGYTAEAQLRDQPNRNGELLADFTIVDSELASGQVSIQLTPAETAALEKNKAYYDLQLTSPTGTINTWAVGEALISGDVTE